MKLFNRSEELGVRVQLEVESFYLFAKILLDKVARALEFYFGPVRSLSLDSHDDLARRVESYAAARDLKAPVELVEAIQRLKTDVSDFRDYRIAHHKAPRTVRGTMWTPSGETHMRLTQIYPTAKDQDAQSGSLEELLRDIDSYLRQIVGLIETNRMRTALRLQRTTSSQTTEL
jgi:hypothetical protein